MREEGREQLELSPLPTQPFLPARQVAAQRAEVLEAVRVLRAPVQLGEGELYAIQWENEGKNEERMNGTNDYSMCRDGLKKVSFPGLEDFVAAVDYHFCLNFLAAFSQPGNGNLAHPCTEILKMVLCSCEKIVPTLPFLKCTKTAVLGSHEATICARKQY